MQDERFERLRREYDFDAWENRGDDVVADDLTLGPDDLPGWKPLQTRRIETPDRPVTTKTVWTRGPDDDELLAVDVYRCASLRDAHVTLLRLLGSFESTALHEQTNAGVGDVAFGLSDPTMLVFARANYVVHVRNAGRKIGDVVSAARALDDKIAGMPA